MGVIRGSSYYQIVEGVNWSSAEANAIALGGNLFSINNESESRWLGNEFSKSKYQYSEDNSAWAPHEWSINHYWSGGIKENGSWRWSNGDSFKTSLSALYLNNSSDQNSDRLLGIFNNPGHTSNIYLDDSRDDYPSNPSNPYKGIAEVPLSYFSISDAEVEEGEKGKIKITRTGGTSTEQTLILATSDGSAVAGDDYKKKIKTLTFAAGETSKTVNIVTNEDIDAESDETINLTLSASSGDAVPAQIQNGSATLTIKNDELKWNNSLYTTITGPTWKEAAIAAKNLGGHLASIATKEEFDFLHQNNFKGWIGLSDPDNSGPVNRDGSRAGWGKNGFSWESGETYRFEGWMQPIFNTDGNYVHFWDGHGGNTVMLGTNDTPPNAPWWEGKGIVEIPLGPTYTITPTVSSSNEGGEVRTNVTTTGVDAGTRLYWTLSGTGIDADDFSTGDLKGSRVVQSDGTITFAHTLANDLTTEGTETLEIKLFSDWKRENQVGDTASVTINDTSLTPAESIFSIDGTNVWEGDTAQVLITRKGNTSAAIDLTVNTVNGTAKSGSDYTQIKDKTIRFGAGVKSKKLSITTKEDSAVESDETFKVKIASTDDLAQFNTKAATVTIEDDDQAVVNNTTNKTNITYNYFNSNNTTVGSNNTTTTINSNNKNNTVNSNNKLSSWNIYRVDQTVKTRDIVGQWFSDSTPISALSQDVNDTKLMDVVEKTWSEKVQINRVVQAKQGGGELIQGKQINKSAWDGVPKGSVLNGSTGGETLRGLAGWDVIDGGDGDDLIHGGNGRDIITGGAGSDELHGDFGWNTYKDQRDGSTDLIAIKSDQHLNNWWYGTSGNSPNGEKTDFIEGLDAKDQIKIIGVFSQDLSFKENVTARGVSGIGIYAKGTLEAVYTGGNLSVGQITQMTSGDGSTAAMNNQMWSYWGDNTVPPLQA